MNARRTPFLTCTLHLYEPARLAAQEWTVPVRITVEVRFFSAIEVSSQLRLSSDSEIIAERRPLDNTERQRTPPQSSTSSSTVSFVIILVRACVCVFGLFVLGDVCVCRLSFCRCFFSPGQTQQLRF